MFGYDTLVNAKVLDADAVGEAHVDDDGRKPVSLEVTLYCHGFPCATCHATTLGPDGMDVVMEPISIARNTYLEVEFTLCDERGKRLYRLPVYIAGRSEQGMNLRFVNTFSKAWHYLDS